MYRLCGGWGVDGKTSWLEQRGYIPTYIGSYLIYMHMKLCKNVCRISLSFGPASHFLANVTVGNENKGIGRWIYGVQPHAKCMLPLKVPTYVPM